MYDSPKDLIRDLAPGKVLSFRIIGRIAGALFLLSIILPLLFAELGFGLYSPSGRGPFLLPIPYSIDLSLFAIEGTVAGPVQTFESAPNARVGIFLGLVDLLIAPVLWLALPLAGVVITILPVIFGIVLLLGHGKHPLAIGLTYILSLTAYRGMLAIKSIEFSAHAGGLLCMAASLLLVLAAIDRIHELGLLADNRYTVETETDTSAKFTR